MIATKNSYIASAYEQLQIISQDKEKRLEYEAREKALRDYNQSMKEAEQRGKQREQFIIAKNMLLKNLDISVIAECTGLSEEEVKTLKEI